MSVSILPHFPVLPSYYATDISRYAGITSNTHPVQPYAYFMFLYQLPVYFPGVAFLLVMMTGLAGVVRNWRRWGGPQALPWALAAVSIVIPAMVTQSLYRYTMVAIPLACVAAGLAFVRLDAEPVAAGVPPDSAPAVSEAASVSQPAKGSGPAKGSRPTTPAGQSGVASDPAVETRRPEGP